jgi:phosphate acetyltransferase
MDVIGRARSVVKNRGLRVVLPEANDPRVLRAACHLVAGQLATPVLLGSLAEIEALAQSEGLTLAGISLVDPKQTPASAAQAKVMVTLRPSMTTAMAARLLVRPLYRAGAMLAAGDVHAMIAGAANPTKRVIEAALMTVGLASGIATPSSYFLMQCPAAVGGPRTVMFADCAVNADPTADQLVDIALATAASAQALLSEPPRVAFLSFSTDGSAHHARVDKVAAAVARAQAIRPDLAIDGEFQADTALSRLVAEKKMSRESSVAGQANVLIFPDLDAGNIAYKLVQYLGGATAIGPFLQGFARPVSDLSRGATVDDIVAAAIITLAQVRSEIG